VEGFPVEVFELPDWFEKLSSPQTDEELSDQTGIDVGQITLARAMILERERVKFSRTPEENYAEYRVQIEGVLRKIDQVARVALNGGPNIRPSAKTAGELLVAKAKLIDQVFVRGQDVGIFPRAAKTQNVKVSGGVIIGAMSTEELFNENRRLKEEGKALEQVYDAVSFSALPDPETHVIDADQIEEDTTGTKVPARMRRKH